MIKLNSKNELIKRKFFNYLKNAGRCCDSTVNNFEKSILVYEDFTENDDFATFRPNRAIEFKEWLKTRQFRGKPISITTYYSYSKNIRKFFLWLSQQAGYKSKIAPDSADYFNLNNKEERMATQSAIRKFPPLDYVIKLTDSIKIDTEIGKRDRALISFTLLSGMRDNAIATFPIGCFDEKNLIINQNPRQGVETKFSKLIYTPLYVFDKRLLEYITEWLNHIKSKGFGSQDPLFPRSKMTKGIDDLSFEEASEVEPIFWQGAGRIREIFKNRARDANLPYYAPHTFRHLAFNLAFKHCKNGEEMKAISQTFGHEYLATSMSIYGNYQPQDLTEIIKGMDFTGKPRKTTEEKIDLLLKKHNIEC